MSEVYSLGLPLASGCYKVQLEPRKFSAVICDVARGLCWIAGHDTALTESEFYHRGYKTGPRIEFDPDQAGPHTESGDQTLGNYPDSLFTDRVPTKCTSYVLRFGPTKATVVAHFADPRVGWQFVGNPRCYRGEKLLADGWLFGPEVGSSALWEETLSDGAAAEPTAPTVPATPFTPEELRALWEQNFGKLDDPATQAAVATTAAQLQDVAIPSVDPNTVGLSQLVEAVGGIPTLSPDAQRLMTQMREQLTAQEAKFPDLLAEAGRKVDAWQAAMETKSHQHAADAIKQVLISLQTAKTKLESLRRDDGMQQVYVGVSKLLFELEKQFNMNAAELRDQDVSQAKTSVQGLYAIYKQMGDYFKTSSGPSPRS